VEDYDYWIRIAKRFPIHPVHEDLYLYRLQGASLSAMKRREIPHAIERLLSEHLRDWPSLSREAKARGFTTIADLRYSTGGWVPALPAIVRALLLAPSGTVRHYWRAAVAPRLRARVGDWF
jgi:hypothetical protein